jgi:hypothetical protein
MYLVYIMHQIHQLFNELEKKINLCLYMKPNGVVFVHIAASLLKSYYEAFLHSFGGYLMALNRNCGQIHYAFCHNF